MWHVTTKVPVHPFAGWKEAGGQAGGEEPGLEKTGHPFGKTGLVPILPPRIQELSDATTRAVGAPALLYNPT